jgi:hypothetical protein
MAHQIKCTFCGGRISVTRDYQRVEGYERRRNQGGTNALRLRQPKGEWACTSCVDKEARGIAATQGGLFP